jgi:hypothetical protein
MKLSVVAIALPSALILAVSLPSISNADTYETFRSPTGVIGCGYGYGVLRCDVAGGLVPKPARPKTCESSWAVGYQLHKTGTATVSCPSDTLMGDKTASVIAYGSSWKRGPFQCTSSASGFRCKNADGHGFMLAKGKSSSF